MLICITHTHTQYNSNQNRQIRLVIIKPDSLPQMDKLIELTNNIRCWNTLGISLLPLLQLVFLYPPSAEAVVRRFLTQMECIQMQLHGKESEGYRLYQTRKGMEAKIHAIKSLFGQENVGDIEYGQRKKVLERFRRKADVIFVIFDRNQADQMERVSLQDRSQHLQLLCLDTSKKQNIIFKTDHTFNLYRQIIKLYESITRFQLISNLKLMRSTQKSIQAQLNRTAECIEVIQGRTDATSYALRAISMCTQHLVCSLEGYYDALQWQPEPKSIRWQVMQLLQELWSIEGDALLKEVDMMSLSYIQQQYKMTDYHSLGGFFPDSCFKAIFSPPLHRFLTSIIGTLNAIIFKIYHKVQAAYRHFFFKSNILEQLLEGQQHKLEELCNRFMDDLHSGLDSQINFIYAPSEQFWNFRQVQSSLYSQEQQANIEIKYIGKVYIRRVYQSIRESLPRQVGHNLLAKLSVHFQKNAFATLVMVLRENTFELQLSQREILEYNWRKKQMVEIDRLGRYFSLKVSSTYLLKEIHERQQKRWKQMYGKAKTVQNRVKEKEEEGGGFVNWMKRLFKKKPQRKRAKSNDKSTIQPILQPPQVSIQKHPHQSPFTQKHWLLLINTNIALDQSKLMISCAYGFPTHLRPAIWLYLAKKDLQQQDKKIKVAYLLKNNKVDELTIRQIDKDIKRTPPPQLFVNGHLSKSLANILQAYSLKDKQIQYTQGMNFITAVILTTLTHYGDKDLPFVDSNRVVNYAELEERSFSILVFLMMQRGLRKMMLVQRDFIADLCMRIDVLIKELNIEVWQIIQGSGFTSEMIFSSPLLSALTTSQVNSRLQRRVMDLIMVRGFSVVYKVIAHFAANPCSQARLKKLKAEQIYDYLKTKMYDDIYEQVGDQGLTLIFVNI